METAENEAVVSHPTNADAKMAKSGEIVWKRKNTAIWLMNQASKYSFVFKAPLFRI